MEVRRFQHCPDAARRPLQILVATAEHECPTSGRLDEVKEHAQRRRLARAVRAEETGHRTPLERERQVVDREDVAEPLGQMLHADHRAVCEQGLRRLRLGRGEGTHSRGHDLSWDLSGLWSCPLSHRRAAATSVEGPMSGAAQHRSSEHSDRGHSGAGGQDDATPPSSFSTPTKECPPGAPRASWHNGGAAHDPRKQPAEQDHGSGS